MAEAAKTDNIFTRSMEAMPPGTTVQQWLETTKEGRIVAIVRELSADKLDAWLCLAQAMAEENAAARASDRALLDACQTYHEAHARARAISSDAEEAWDAACLEADEAGQRSMALAPATRVGLAAKARVAREMIQTVRPFGEPDGNWDDTVADRLIGDVLALFGGAEVRS